MSFRSMREHRLLSQERLAEMSGLSLRTIQRVEAGHRVSYASLRALAATLEMDVDLLERELYAMNQSADDFVETPTWVRLFKNASGGRWMGAKPLSRRQAHVEEALCMGGGVVFLVASLLFALSSATTVFRVSAALMFTCGYLLSVGIRIYDKYKLWPAAEVSWSEWRPVRTVRTTIGFYGFVLLVLVSFFAVLFWLGN